MYPTGPVAVPAAVTALAAGAALEPVWRNELGGLTFRTGDGRFVKWVAAGTPEVDFAAEATRLAWAAHWVRVPRVLAQDADEHGAWLVTAALPGTSAVHPRWLADPRTAALGIGAGLRLLHDALPVPDCPFDWSPEFRLARAGAELAQPPPEPDRLVVCHGDACAPNTLLHDDGSVAGHVDLGSLGVADRWADLAVAAWSTEWNYGPGHTDAVYQGYGVPADRERIDYYRRLWDAT